MKTLSLLSIIFAYLFVFAVVYATETGPSLVSIGKHENEDSTSSTGSTGIEDSDDSTGSSTTTPSPEVPESGPEVVPAVESESGDTAEHTKEPIIEQTQEITKEEAPELDVVSEATVTTAVEVEKESQTDKEATYTTDEITTDVPKDETGETSDKASTAVSDVSGDEVEVEKVISDSINEAVEGDEKYQDEAEESLSLYDYEVPLRVACETKKLICHNISSNAVTIQGSRRGSAIFASFDATAIRGSGLTMGDVVSAKITINKIGGNRTLPIRVDVLDLESKSSHISKSTVLDTFQAVLPKTQNTPISVEVTSALHKLLEKAKDPDNFCFLISAHSRTRFGDVLTFPTGEFPNGLSLKLKTTKALKSPSGSSPGSENGVKMGSIKDNIFSGSSLYIAVGIFVTVVIIIAALMMM
ncbi:transmembrane protein [Cryptosporidium felis]|nr:transmembrane protein [Cryptosporidium felis]